MSRSPNPLLAKIEANHREHLMRTRMFVRQLCEDMAVVALNEGFGFGEERSERFVAELCDVFMQWAVLLDGDYRVDKDLVYSTAKFEERLKQVRGKYYVPHRERYYFIYQDDKKR